MPRTPRERHNDEFRTLWESSRRSREWTANILDVSPHTVVSWLKPATSKSSNRCPKWAVDLLRIKLREAEEGQGVS